MKDIEFCNIDKEQKEEDLDSDDENIEDEWEDMDDLELSLENPSRKPAYCKFKFMNQLLMLLFKATQSSNQFSKISDQIQLSKPLSINSLSKRQRSELDIENPEISENKRSIKKAFRRKLQPCTYEIFNFNNL